MPIRTAHKSFYQSVSFIPSWWHFWRLIFHSLIVLFLRRMHKKEKNRIFFAKIQLKGITYPQKESCIRKGGKYFLIIGFEKFKTPSILYFNEYFRKSLARILKFICLFIKVYVNLRKVCIVIRVKNCIILGIKY